MTGIYLFNKDREPTEVEYLTKEERHKSLSKQDSETLLGYIDALCENIVETDTFLRKEGYTHTEDDKDEQLDL